VVRQFVELTPILLDLGLKCGDLVDDGGRRVVVALLLDATAAGRREIRIEACEPVPVLAPVTPVVVKAVVVDVTAIAATAAFPEAPMAQLAVFVVVTAACDTPVHVPAILLLLFLLIVEVFEVCVVVGVILIRGLDGVILDGRLLVEEVQGQGLGAAAALDPAVALAIAAIANLEGHLILGFGYEVNVVAH